MDRGEKAIGRLDPHEEPRPVTPHAGERAGLDLDDPERVTRSVARTGPQESGRPPVWYENIRDME
jgi:hypothetical protein